MAPSMSRVATPGSGTWRTTTSRRGRSTVALRYLAPSDLKNFAYSDPHSAAGRPAKSRIARRPSTRMRPGRTRAATTSRSLPPISIPTPEPNCISFRRSLGIAISSGMAGSIAPSRAVPPQDVNGIEARGHVLYLRRQRASKIGEPPIGEPRAGRRAERENGIASQAQAVRGCPDGFQKRLELLDRKRRGVPAFHKGRDGVGTQADGGQDRRRSRVGVHTVARAEHRKAIRQARARNQPLGVLRAGFRTGRVGSVEDIGGDAFHEQ